MPRKKKPSWKPATEFKTTKLKRSGPKPGTNVNSYLYARQKADEELMDNPRTKFNDLP